MKKILFLTVLFLIAFLAGCNQPQTLRYKGVTWRLEEVEEMISDQLEVENPAEDLNVKIYFDSEE
jgi:hypothetical protein